MTLCYLQLLLIIAAYSPVISAQGGNGNHTFRTISNCKCIGYNVTFQCDVNIGNTGWTKWTGSAFICPNSGNEIILHGDRRLSKECNGGHIVGQTLPSEDNIIYPSQLDVTLAPSLIERAIKCVYDDGANHETIIGGTSLLPTTDPFPPPLDIHLADVGHNLLKFNWTAVSNCVPLLYETSASESCGACPRHTTVASASCAFNFSHVPGVCGFAVRTIVCNNITGNWSKPINVTLKVPDPVITTIQANYTADGDLTAVTIEFRESDQDVRNTANYVHSYSWTIVYADAVTGLVCDSQTTVNLTSFAPRSCFPASNNILASISGTNRFGDGRKVNITISKTNQYISVSTSAEEITCKFLEEQAHFSTRLCNVSYGRCTGALDSWTSQWNYTTTNSLLMVKTDFKDYCYIVSATIDNVTTIVITGNHTSKGGGAQQRWEFLAFLLLICVPPVIFVAFVYRYRCVCAIVELLSKVVRSHSNGNYTEYQMHAAFELQNKPGTLLQVLTILTEKGIDIETTKIGKHTPEGIGKIYMRFTSNLTDAQVEYVENKVNSLESCTGCVIHTSPQLELAEAADGTSTSIPTNESNESIAAETYSLLVSSSPGALQTFLQGMTELQSRDGIQYNITGIVDIPITMCRKRLGYLIKLNICNAPGHKFPRNWWKELDSIK